MKHNGTQATYHSVPQNLQNDEIEESKKVPSHESVVENGQNAKTSPTPSKELQEDGAEDEKKPMSPLRKFCFVLSLLQCVLFIVAFGWLIPCKIPRHSDRSHTHNWEVNFYGEDFITNLAITGSEQKPVVLVFGYSYLSNVTLFGVRAINAFDGSSMWQKEMVSKPIDVICNTFDFNSDKIPDCIITDDTGSMFAVSAVDSQIIWHMHDHRFNIDRQLMSKPIVGQSCHGDRVQYVYAAIQDKQGLYYFVTVSGLTGEIEEMYKLPECALMPENLMWRNGKEDAHEMDPSQELVMSCVNEAGNWIVYNINTDDICKNITTHEMFFKVAIIDKSKEPFHLKLLSTNEGDNVVTLTGDKLEVHSEEKEEQVQFAAESGVHFKDFVVGRFANNSLANIMILGRSESINLDSISLLDNTKKHVLWNTVIENGTAVGIFTFKNGLNSHDTVLLKVVSETTETHPDHENITSHLTDLTHFEEKFVVLECFDSGSFKTFANDFTMASCKDSHCIPDVFGEKETALLFDVDDDEKEELIYFTRKTLPSTFVQSVTLKLVRLSEPGSTKSCSSCHC